MRNLAPLPPIPTRPAPPQSLAETCVTVRHTTPRRIGSDIKSSRNNSDLLRPSFPEINDELIFASKSKLNFSKQYELKPNNDYTFHHFGYKLPTHTNQRTEQPSDQEQVNNTLCRSKKTTESKNVLQSSPPTHPIKPSSHSSFRPQFTPTKFNVVSHENKQHQTPIRRPPTSCDTPTYRHGCGSPPTKPSAHAGPPPPMPSPPSFRALSRRSSSKTTSPSFHGHLSKARHFNAGSSSHGPNATRHYAPTYVISPEGSRVRSHVPRNNIQHLISPNGSRTELVTPSGAKTWILRPNGSNTFIDGRFNSGPRKMSQDILQTSSHNPLRHLLHRQHEDLAFGSQSLAAAQSLSNTSQSSSIDSISYQHLHKGFKCKETLAKNKVSTLPKSIKVRKNKKIPKWESSNKIRRMVSSHPSFSAQRVSVSTSSSALSTEHTQRLLPTLT